MLDRGYAREGARYRVVTACNDVIVFACHAGVIQTLLAHLINAPLPICYSQFAVDPSSRTTLVLEEKDGYGVFRMTCLNDMSHAAGLESTVSQAGTFPAS
jgi:probable phosphoglycerate mutase